MHSSYSRNLAKYSLNREFELVTLCCIGFVIINHYIRISTRTQAVRLCRRHCCLPPAFTWLMSFVVPAPDKRRHAPLASALSPESLAMYQHAPKRLHRGAPGGGDSADDSSGGAGSAASSISQAAVFSQASFPPAAMTAAAHGAAASLGPSGTRAAGGYSHAPTASTHSSAYGHGHAHSVAPSHGHASSSSASSASHPTGVKHLGGLGALQWSEEEDRLLSEAIARHGTDDWTKVASLVPKRTPQQCMSRWCKALGNEGSRGPWDASEDAVIREAVS